MNVAIRLFMYFFIRLRFVFGIMLIVFGLYIGFTKEGNFKEIVSFLISLWLGVCIILNSISSHLKWSD